MENFTYRHYNLGKNFYYDRLLKVTNESQNHLNRL